MSGLVDAGSDEAFLLSVFGITLLVAGIARQLEVSGAIGAFLVGLALCGKAEQRASRLLWPWRDLFAATFLLSFSFQFGPADLLDAAVPAVALFVVTALTKVATGWYAAGRAGAAPKGWLRAGTVLIACGEFSIVIAVLGAGLVDGAEPGALAAGYVLLSAMVGADRVEVLGPDCAPAAPHAPAVCHHTIGPAVLRRIRISASVDPVDRSIDGERAGTTLASGTSRHRIGGLG